MDFFAIICTILAIATRMWRGSGKPTAKSVMEARLWMRGGREVRVLKAIVFQPDVEVTKY